MSRTYREVTYQVAKGVNDADNRALWLLFGGQITSGVDDADNRGVWYESVDQVAKDIYDADGSRLLRLIGYPRVSADDADDM